MDDQHAGQNTLGDAVYENVRLVGDVHVEMTTFDQALAQHGRGVDVMKIDVEGAEFAVLSGAGDAPGSKRPVLLMELQNQSLLAQGSSALAVIDLLERYEYEVCGYADKTCPGPLCRLEDSAAAISQDVVAIPAERSAHVLGLL